MIMANMPHTHTPVLEAFHRVCAYICCDFASFSSIVTSYDVVEGLLAHKFYFLGAYKNSFHTICARFISTVAFFLRLVGVKMGWVSHDVPLVNSLESRLFGCCRWWFLIRMMTTTPFKLLLLVGPKRHKKNTKRPLLLQSSWQASSELPAARIEGKNGQRFLLWLNKITQSISKTHYWVYYTWQWADSLVLLTPCLGGKNYLRSRKWLGYIRNTTKSRKNAQQTPQPLRSIPMLMKE